MKKIDIARLVIFFLAGIGLYFYMSNAVAAETDQSDESDRMLYMKPTEAYKIWNAINALEHPWFLKNSNDPRYKRIRKNLKQEKPSESISLEPLPLEPLKQEKVIALQLLVQNYPSLTSVVNDLIAARRAGNMKKFLHYKEKIAEYLRPRWQIGAEETMKEEAQKRSMYNRFKNWLAAWRQRVYNTMQRAYAYFFSTAPSSSADKKLDTFQQQLLGKTPEPAPKEEPVPPAPVVDKK